WSAVDGSYAGGRGWTLGRGFRQHRAYCFCSRCLPRVVADLRRSSFRCGEEQRYAKGFRHRERESRPSGGPLADQYHRPALRRQYLFLPRCIRAYAESHQFDVAHSLPARGGIRVQGLKAWRILRDEAGGAHTRHGHGLHSRDLYGFLDLRWGHEVRPARGRSLWAGNAALLLDAARAKHAGVHQDIGLGYFHPRGRGRRGRYLRARVRNHHHLNENLYVYY